MDDPISIWRGGAMRSVYYIFYVLIYKGIIYV